MTNFVYLLTIFSESESWKKFDEKGYLADYLIDVMFFLKKNSLSKENMANNPERKFSDAISQGTQKIVNEFLFYPLKINRLKHKKLSGNEHE